MELDFPFVRGFTPHGTSVGELCHVIVRDFADVSDKCDAVSAALRLEASKSQFRVNYRFA